MAFGSRLRLRLAVRGINGHELREQTAEAVWHGSDHRPQDALEKDADHELNWGRGFCYQRRHHLFDPLRSHLQKNRCWEYLEQFEAGLSRYYIAELRLLSQVRQRIEDDPSFARLEGNEIEACRFLQRRTLWTKGRQGLKQSDRLVLEGLFDNRFRQRYLEPPYSGPDRRRLQLLDEPHNHEINQIARSAEIAGEPGRALIDWYDTIIPLVRLAVLWIRSIGPEAVLRQAITKGSCRLCPA